MVVRLSLMLTTAMLEVIVLLLLSSSVAMVQGFIAVEFLCIRYEVSHR